MRPSWQEYLERQDYEVTAIWEHKHDNDQRVKFDSDFETFVKAVKACILINAREAFHGGSTNAAKLHHRVSKDEKTIAVGWLI